MTGAAAHVSATGGTRTRRGATTKQTRDRQERGGRSFGGTTTVRRGSPLQRFHGIAGDGRPPVGSSVEETPGRAVGRFPPVGRAGSAFRPPRGTLGSLVMPGSPATAARELQSRRV